MKKTLITLSLLATLALPAWAQMQHGGAHGGAPAGAAAAPGERLGEKIHQSTVDGHTIDYHLIDNVAAMAKMGDMKGHDMSQMKSHHLMAYVQGPGGKAIADAKVGYLVTGPTGEVAKIMAPAMDGGYGADVDLKAKGAYEIKLKAVAGEIQLLDTFTYEVK